MVITQEPTQSLTALHVPGAADACIAGEQQDIVLPLMIALSMVMLDVFAQGEPQGALAEEDYLGQALLLYRPDPALRIGFRFGLRAGSTSGSTRPETIIARNDWVYLVSRSCRR
jgi:hypothetical protein